MDDQSTTTRDGGGRGTRAVRLAIIQPDSGLREHQEPKSEARCLGGRSRTSKTLAPSNQIQRRGDRFNNRFNNRRGGRSLRFGIEQTLLKVPNGVRELHGESDDKVGSAKRNGKDFHLEPLQPGSLALDNHIIRNLQKGLLNSEAKTTPATTLVEFVTSSLDLIRGSQGFGRSTSTPCCTNDWHRHLASDFGF